MISAGQFGIRQFDTPLTWLLAAVVLAIFSAVLFVSAQSSGDVESGVYRVQITLDRGGGHGSGFKVADPGYIVTNYHVVRGAARIDIGYVENGKSRIVPARVSWQNPRKDLAILETIRPLPGPPVRLASIGADELEKTDAVTAVGFPGAADDLARVIEDGRSDKETQNRTLLNATVSTGIIQRLVPSVERLTIQHSANISPGNSGGPLFDSCDRVVGVNTLSQVAIIGAVDILDAILKTGRLAVQTSGALESAVHVQEVIGALADKRIDATMTSGRCRNGIDRGEMSAMGITMILALASMALAGVRLTQERPENRLAVLSRLRRPEPGDGSVGVFMGSSDVETGKGGPPALVFENLMSGDAVPLAPYRTKIIDSGLIVGRSGADCDLVIDDNSVSRSHARISFHPPDGYVIHDLGSTNGTKVDGLAATQTQGRLLEEGSLLVFGDAQFNVRYKPWSPVASSAAKNGSWLLSGFDREGNTIQHAFESSGDAADGQGMVPLVHIGRASDNEMIVDDLSVSRHHAVIGMNEQGQLSIKDLRSSNGTQVDGRPVSGAPMEIERAKTIEFGEISIAISRQS